MSSSSTPSTKVCFNFHCKEALERPRQGWRRRTGEFADLCDRCSSAYDEGKFCETFHLNSSGWRSCESCGQQIHCGCIVSFHTFVLLDAGGIECLTCARKSYILTPNPAWPPPSLFLPLQPEQIKDVKSWTPIAGSGPVPWRQAPGLFNGFTNQRYQNNGSTIHSELQPRTPFLDASGSIGRLCVSEVPSASSSDNQRKEEPFERVMNGKLKISLAGRLENGFAGLNCDEQRKSSLNAPEQPSFAKNDISASVFFSTIGSACKIEPNDHSKVCTTLMQPTTLLSHLGNQSGGHAAVGSAGESQVNNTKTRSDGRGKRHLLPRYWPRITDQELQQISGDSNSVITPLFEKVLTASDAGRIGRLVLPKKCAEAYFPPISHPEGLPLKVQDLKGKEWVFQFRFWPNNNSRMYVLEGVTPCIQSMQLHAGDIVIFSRIEPEGKLVMGCRKASTILTADQGNEACNKGNGVVTNGNVSTKLFTSGFSSTHAAAVDSTSLLPESKKSDGIVKTSIGNRSVRCKRKSSSLGSKSKHMRIDSDILVELKLTVVQAQGLIRPPPCGVPRVIVIEGCEFEEFEQDAPIIGRPTVPSISHLGEKIQWVQCEDCFKWRKIPLDAILPSRWTCSENLWDPERSMCSAVQELTAEHLGDILPLVNRAAKKMKASNQEIDSAVALEGLDALANLAIQEGDETLPESLMASTKHPRHRPGCTCIVCIQPPSGKGPKHKETCECSVCKSVKRRSKTLTLKREKKLSERDAEATCQKLQPEVVVQLLDADIQASINDAGNISRQQEDLNSESSIDDPNLVNEKKSFASPFNGEIDLNIKPDREDEHSPGSDPCSTKHLLHNATGQYVGHCENGSTVGNQEKGNEDERANWSNCAIVDGNHQTDVEHDRSLPIGTAASNEK